MSQAPRILHLTHEMAIGGTQQVISQLVSNLDNNRFDCEIGCIDGQVGQLGEALESGGMKIHVFHRGAGFDLSLIKAVRRLLKDNHFDIVHCHQYTPYVYGVFASMFTSVKVVFTEHGRFYPDSYSWKRRLLNPLLGKLTDSIVAISDATGRALVEYEWFSQRQIKTIYNGLDPKTALGDSAQWREDIAIPTDAIVFGTIARFDPIKNIPMMINAFKEVHTVNPNTRLLLVGDGPERQALEQCAKNAGLTDSVVFTGFQQQTAELMALMDVYLLSSFSEGTSMTLLEAMSSSTCSIVTGVGGNVELIEHGSTGIVVESEDTAALATWMLNLASDPQQRKTLGDQAAVVFQKHFSVTVMIDGYSSIYDAVSGP